MSSHLRTLRDQCTASIRKDWELQLGRPAYRAALDYVHHMGHLMLYARMICQQSSMLLPAQLAAVSMLMPGGYFVKIRV